MNTIKVNSLNDFLNALKSQEPVNIELQSSILFPCSLHLPEGFTITGVSKERSIMSFNSSEGVGLTKDNSIEGVSVLCNPNSRAIFIVGNDSDLGLIELRDLRVIGQVQILTREPVQKTKLVAENIDIVSCDARHYSEQPQKYGVNVYQGAFTVYNYNSDPNSLIDINLKGISVGREGAPVFGSGLFVSGFSDNGGWVKGNIIETFDIYSIGMIPFGQPNMITGGVFAVYGTHITTIHNKGTVTTYGVNDMVLDTWGEVDNWICDKKITSYGPSGIGFVNFGIVKSFVAHDTIETFGQGARGFNQYDGTVGRIEFKSIITHGDGSIAVQVSKPIGEIVVNENIETFGSVGKTLVKGVILTLSADGLSIKEGGLVDEITVKGDIITHGDNVVSYSVNGGEVKNIIVNGKVIAEGDGSQRISVVNNGKTDIKNLH
ncbi:hypothetical protein K5X82_06775 [Halosquirtibacter xylanolyticus]|uniref:hypothetical protein n=1 Tax=Halosquirtibacter xylanolyticus TaxID=3374599 RepID=UPI0037498423|nr:hypothetical protein K5X82_06775 [Prolixibacteraceae bacterium]